MNNTYQIEWYGPFSSQEEEKEWELQQSEPSNLYIIYGKTKYAKTNGKYYVGQTKRFVCKRLADKDHHIKEFSSIIEIWVGRIVNVNVKTSDINKAEKMLTSYMGQILGAEKMLNQINYYTPGENVYMISEWYKPYIDEKWRHNKNNSPAKIVPDVIAYRVDWNCGGETSCYTCNKLKQLW